MKLKNPISFIKKANKSFNLFLENYKQINKIISNYEQDQDKINNFIANYGQDQDKINNFIANYGQDQDKINNFLNNYVKKEDLNKVIEILHNNYYTGKTYFFNGEEQSFNIRDSDRFYQMCSFNNIKILSHSPSENRMILKTEDGIIIETNNRFYTMEEVFTRKGYSVPQLYMFKEFVVFDIGMNRGYASLMFANFDSCKSVYGFEIDDDTYKLALENFKLNPNLSKKIRPFNFGLYDEDRDIDIHCLPGSDGITTIESEFTELSPEWINGKDEMKIKKANVKDAGSVISDIIKNNNINCNIVLKIDTEGAEHKIIDSIINSNILNKIDLIMGESHLEESKNIGSKLDGFKKVNETYHTDTFYSFCYVKEKYYNVLPLSKF